MRNICEKIIQTVSVIVNEKNIFYIKDMNINQGEIH